jgi:exosome complex component RRP4
MPREVVLPGEVLGKEGTRAGRGAFVEGDTVFAAQLGVKAVRDDYVAVIPLAGRYIPKTGDEVIGKIVDIMPNTWLVEINSPYNAPLHADETPWDVSYGETGRFLTVGDLVLAEVKSVDYMKRIYLTMTGRGLRRLSGGQMIQVSHSKVPRIIGKGGSMIRLLKDRTGCRIHVGQNGRIWLEGAPDMIRLATDAIRLIERDAHIHGLTEKIGKYLDGLLNPDKADAQVEDKVEVTDAPEDENGPVPKEGE